MAEGGGKGRLRYRGRQVPAVLRSYCCTRTMREVYYAHVKKRPTTNDEGGVRGGLPTACQTFREGFSPTQAQPRFSETHVYSGEGWCGGCYSLGYPHGSRRFEALLITRYRRQTSLACVIRVRVTPYLFCQALFIYKKIRFQSWI